MTNDVFSSFLAIKNKTPQWFRKYVPNWIKAKAVSFYWKRYDLLDFLAEVTGKLPSHTIRFFVYRYVLKISIGQQTSIHRNCRFYNSKGILIKNNTVINRDVLLDGRKGLIIGSNVSISEGTAIFSLEHDPNSQTFAAKGAPVIIDDYVFIGSRAIILPGIHIEKGAVIGAGSIVTRNVPAYTIVAGVPARSIGQRSTHLTYFLNYKKFLG
ncbi:MAG: acyltransferase [Anaerolineales bacterium]|nr:acyltransferase [Anaerolineales bacterium]